jgi:hypothetical protein
MSTNACPYESEVSAAARSGKWTERLRSHSSECRDCDSLARVAMWMANLATQLGRDNEALPDPTYVWLKAQIERRAAETCAVSRRRVSSHALVSLAGGLAGSAAVLAALPAVSSAASAALTWLVAALMRTSSAQITLIGSVWVGLPLFLVATYLLVFRPTR